MKGEHQLINKNLLHILLYVIKLLLDESSLIKSFSTLVVGNLLFSYKISYQNLTKGYYSQEYKEDL